MHAQLYPTEEENEKSPIHEKNNIHLKKIDHSHTPDSSDESMKKGINRRTSSDSAVESHDLLGTTRTLISPLTSATTLAPHASHLSHIGAAIPEEPMNSMVNIDVPLNLEEIRKETERRKEEGIRVGKMLIISIAYKKCLKRRK